MSYWSLKDRAIAAIVLYASTAAIAWLFGWAVSLAFSCGLVNYDEVILDYVVDHGCPSVANCTTITVKRARAHANDVAFAACFKYCWYAVGAGVCIATLVVLVYWGLRAIRYCQENGNCGESTTTILTDLVQEYQAKQEYYRSPTVRPLLPPPQRVMIANLSSEDTTPPQLIL